MAQGVDNDVEIPMDKGEQVKYRRIEKYEIRSTKIRSFKCLSQIMSLTACGNNRIWCNVSGKESMYLYNENGEVVKSVSVEGSGGIHGMAMTKSGDMIVSCRDNTIRRLSLDDDNMTMSLVDTSPFNPAGLCLNVKGDIVVCLLGEMKRNHVAIFSSNGKKKIREVRAWNSKSKEVVSNPLRVVQLQRDYIILDGGSHVARVNEEGYCKWIYGERQANQPLSFLPRDICVDRFNNVMITDCNNHCVHYICGKGKLIQIILTKEETGLGYQWGLSIDEETDNVWIESEFGHMAIVRYLH